MTSAVRQVAATLGRLAFHARTHDLVLGVPGSGKTHLAKRLTASVRRAVFFDPTGHDFATCGERVRALDLWDPEVLHSGRFLRLVVVPGEDVAGDFTRTVAALRYACASAPVLLVADEVGDYSTPCASVLTRLHRNGHHDGVTSLLVSQCAVDIPKTCRRTATRVFSLLQTASADLDALETEYGADFAESVRRWRPGDPPAVWALPTLYR